MADPKNAVSKERVESYNRLIDTLPEVHQKGKTTPYTSVNGHMFSFLAKNGDMGLRLSSDDRNDFIDKHNSQLMEQHGRVMKEYVKVSMNMLCDSRDLPGYFKKSYNYVSGLKPKPTKRK